MIDRGNYLSVGMSQRISTCSSALAVKVVSWLEAWLCNLFFDAMLMDENRSGNQSYFLVPFQGRRLDVIVAKAATGCSSAHLHQTAILAAWRS